MPTLKRTIWILLIVTLFSHPAGAVNRIALVIGNGDYPSTLSSNPVIDTFHMANTLEKQSFEPYQRTLDIRQEHSEGLPLETGRHRVLIANSGYTTKYERVPFEPGKSLGLYAELDRQPTAPTSADPDSRTWIEPSTGMVFVWVPGGCYRMGCDSWAGECYDNDEKKVHEVCLDGFWMGKYEVTQGQWKKVMGDNPSKFKKGDDWPVERVSWNETQAFIDKLSSRSNGRYQFKLPSEAQWEYAARSGGKLEKYAGGSDVDRLAWHMENSGKTTHRVGTKAPNGLGLYDMSGNVWEWCEDAYDENGYSRHSRYNPVVISEPSGDNVRVLRGGSNNTPAKPCSTVYRYRFTPDFPGYDLGFRLTRSK